MSEWNLSKPPSGVWLEVFDPEEHRVVTAKAIWGDEDTGVRPHWETEDGWLVEASAYTKWRHVDGR